MAGTEWEMLKVEEEENILSICSGEKTGMHLCLHKEIIHRLPEDATDTFSIKPLHSIPGLTFVALIVLSRMCNSVELLCWSFLQIPREMQFLTAEGGP